VNSSHQQLFSLFVDRVLRIASKIGMRVRAMPGDPGPFRRRGGEEQPRVKARTIRCLKIINSVEAATAQDAAERRPGGHLEELRPGVDGDLVKETALLRERGECTGRQQRDLVRGMVLPDRRCRPERLDKISERAQLDDEDLTPR